MKIKELAKTKSEIMINVAYTIEVVPESKDYNSRDFEIEYLKQNVCENPIEQEIIERVLKRAPSGATIKRYRAYLQNTMGLYKKSEDKKNKDKELQEEFRNEFKNKKTKKGIITRIIDFIF